MFIEEIVGWDDLNEWTTLLYDAYNTSDHQEKNALIMRAIAKLERSGAHRIEK
jgi:hypothetical protein